MSTEIDWAEQWANHAPGFQNGLAHVQLPINKEIQLLPGPGFGDNSHATTQLMLKLMMPYVAGKFVFDIGCGCGILSLAAKKMGAFQVYSCDIDPESILHTEKNAALNQLKLNLQIPNAFSKKPVILMNMISSEQEQAWQQHQCPFETLITSGILASQKTVYLEFAKKQNWQLLHEHRNEDWLGFIFKETI